MSENNTQDASTEGENDGFNGGTAQHTPGPWRVTGLSRHGFYAKVRGTRLGLKFPVANCPFVPDDRADKAEAEANARLIAAAPDLFSALTCIMHWVDRTNVTNPDALPAIDAAHAAIAKARGASR